MHDTEPESMLISEGRLNRKKCVGSASMREIRRKQEKCLAPKDYRTASACAWGNLRELEEGLPSCVAKSSH